MILGELIKEYREKNNLSLRDFAKKCGLSHTYISALEKNIDPRTGKPIAPTLDTVKYISKGMNISIEYILKILDDEQEFTINAEAPKYSKNLISIPLLGTVKAGYDYLANENIIDYIPVTDSSLDNENFFALKVKGDSMVPEIYEGDIAIVRKQDDFENGDYVVALINGDEATIKKGFKSDTGLLLQPVNTSVPPLIFDKNTIQSMPVKIIGVVYNITRSFK